MIIDKRPDEITPEQLVYDELIGVYKMFGPDTGPRTKGPKRVVGDALAMFKQITSERDSLFNEVLELQERVALLEQRLSDFLSGDAPQACYDVDPYTGSDL